MEISIYANEFHLWRENTNLDISFPPALLIGIVALWYAIRILRRDTNHIE